MDENQDIDEDVGGIDKSAAAEEEEEQPVSQECLIDVFVNRQHD